MRLEVSDSLPKEKLVLFVSAETRKERLQLCGVCEHIKQLPLIKYRTCSKCGCLVEAKASFKFEKCPAGKWVESDTDYQPPATP